MKFVLATFSGVLTVLLGSAAAQNGEEACEGRGFNQQQCLDVGCCYWEEGGADAGCWSGVGQDSCVNPSSGGGGEPLLVGLQGWRDGQGVVWHDPPSRGGWGSCGKVTTVFGVAVCVSKLAWASSQGRTRADHIAHVFYQLLDNDADGSPDDPAVLSRMVSNGYLLWVPDGEADSEQGELPDDAGVDQMTGVHEAFPNNCQAPANRGADPNDRSTWASAVTNTRGCDTRRDATTEEILHLITPAAAAEYPDLWGLTFGSELGRALKAANGNCGHGYLGNWIDPSSGQCTGHWAFNVRSCDEECNVVEGLYWAVTSYIGGLYTATQTGNISNEWLMATPDATCPSGPGERRTR